MLPSYPKVYALGHRAIEDIFQGPVIVQEKVDGSQFSFGLVDGELEIRSKAAVIFPDNPPQMFAAAVETVRGLHEQGRLNPGVVYRAEVLTKPKHNIVAYGRVPRGCIALFDLSMEGEHYALPDATQGEADRLGLDVVPLLYVGEIKSLSQLEEFLKLESFLGGSRVEGVIVKNYSRFTPEKTAMMGKLVLEEFKELNATNWRESNPHQKDVVAGLIDSLATEARWQKAVQHLAEGGTLEQSLRDIGLLIRTVQEDVKSEEIDWIKDRLFQHFWHDIQRGVARGLPEWYKKQLAASNFDKGDSNA